MGDKWEALRSLNAEFKSYGLDCHFHIPYLGAEETDSKAEILPWTEVCPSQMHKLKP